MEDRIAKLFEKTRNGCNFLETLLVQCIAGREILVWGGITRNDFWLAFAERHNIAVAGYIDSDVMKTELNGYPIWHPDVVSVENYYIIVGLEKRYDDVMKKLQAWGKEQMQDYFYAFQNQITLTYCMGNYLDYYGNRIQGVVDGFLVSMSVGATLIIGSGCKIDKSVKIILKKGATLILEDGCYLGEKCTITVMDGGMFYIGRKCRGMKHAKMLCGRNSKIFIDEACTFGPELRIVSYLEEKLLIHRDCMFSSDILIQMSNGHSLFDLEKKESINSAKGKLIEVGEHVWIGRRCILRYGASIQAGSMIGMESLIVGEVPKNALAAGNPLKILRENIAWSREKDTEDWNVFEGYDFREGNWD